MASAAGESGKALDELLRIYRPVLRFHAVARLGVPEDRADDLVQNFIMERMLQRNLLALAKQERGRFRNFLARVFTNYAASQARRARALKRGPTDSHVLNLDEEPDLVACEPEVQRSFELTWAKQVLAETLKRMQQECAAKQRSDLWEVFAGRIVRPALEGEDPLAYDDLIRKFGCLTPSQASNILITAKRMFRRVLEEVVRDTVTDPAEVAGEIEALQKILSGGAGSLRERRSK